MPKWGGVVFVIQLVILILVAILYTDLANAHSRFALNSATPPRSDNSGIKTGPCGGYPRSTTPAVFTPGQQITVQWEETINHPGYFRIAFSPADDLDFDANVLYQVDDNQNDSQVPHFYTANITLPNTPCQTCSLQLIQYMTEVTPPNLYYSCADIQIISTDPPPNVQNVLSASGNNEISLAWQYPSADPLQVLILQSDTTVTQAPVPGTVYQVGDVLGNATVVYTGNGSQFVARPLIDDQTYTYTLYTQSQANIYASGVEIQQTVPTFMVNGTAPAAVTQLQVTEGNTSARLDWINPSDNFYKVVVLWDTSPIVVDPVENQRYDVGAQIGTAHVVFAGLSNTATITNLNAGQRHYFKVYAHNGSFNYAPGQNVDVFISTSGVNAKPQLSLVLTQNGSPVTRIYQDKGVVVASLIVQDDNDINQAVISWAGTDTRLIDMDLSDLTLTFDPSMLAAGTYTVRVAVADNGIPPQTGTLTTGILIVNPNNEDTTGGGSIGHLALLLFLILLQRYYTSRTRIS